MTCIVGIAENGKVYIGGDSAGVGGYYHLEVRSDEKVFKNDEYLFGFTSSFRMGQLLRFKFHAPERSEKMADDYKFMVTTFTDAIRECLKAGGYATTKDSSEQGGVFLVGYRGKLYKIEGDYQVGMLADGFSAVGCGAQIALGSLYSTRVDPNSRILVALAAAERFSAGVRGPFTVLDI